MEFRLVITHRVKRTDKFKLTPMKLYCNIKQNEKDTPMTKITVYFFVHLTTVPRIQGRRGIKQENVLLLAKRRKRKVGPWGTPSI